LIDNDTVRFTVDVLRGWKQMSEQMTQQELDAMTSSGSRDLLGTSGRLTAILQEATEHFDQLSMSGATGPLAPEAAEVARELEHRISDVVVDALALKANPLFDEADRQETAIAVKTMRAALRLRGFQHFPAYVDYDQDTFRAYIPARQNEYEMDSVERARAEFVDAFDQFERLTGLRTLRIRGA
jgi:hypothetical protein